MAKGLTRRQEIFAAEYCVDSDGKRAAIKAGYSEKTAESQASQLLKNPKVSDVISKKTQKILNKLEISAEKVLQELALLGFSNMLNYVTIGDDGQADIDLSKLTREQAAAIQEISVDATGGTGDGERRQVLRTKFKLSDKRGALELLGKHLKLFTEKIELNADGALIARLMEGRRRVAEGK